MNIVDVDKILKLDTLMDFNQNWEITKLISSNIDDIKSREIIIHILDIWENVNDDAKHIWIDLIERLGMYPYFMKKIGSEAEMYEMSLQQHIKTLHFKSNHLEGVYFHSLQKEIERLIYDRKNVAVSAPTSFGKSLLIEEIVASQAYNNILIIQPTLALIDETRRKLTKYENYNVIVNVHQKQEDKNIFILTGERVIEYTDFEAIDFLIVDEFYKISNRAHDDRIDTLNVAFLKAVSYSPQILLLTPVVDSLSDEFLKKYDVCFFKTLQQMVNTKIEIIKNNNDQYYKQTSEEKKEKLFEMLESMDEPSIVYTKSPEESYQLALEYLEYLSRENKLKEFDFDVLEWIDENISPEWQLKKILKYGVGVHNGILPRHLGVTIVSLFNSRKISTLFATATLIEGVNTVAKNMFIYSTKKGNNNIDYFDYSNIRGRAGRMGEYFTGNVYLFNKEPDKLEYILDVPITDQENISDEILVNIPDDDVHNISRKQELEEGLESGIKNIIKENLISVKGQKELYFYLRDHYQDYIFLSWTGIPGYEILKKTLMLGYEFLQKKKVNEKFINMYAIRTLKLVNGTLKETISDQIIYNLKHEKNINKDRKEIIDKSINEILQFQRSVAGFEIPKILNTLFKIQEYVAQERGLPSGDYSYFIAMLENEKINEKFQFLIDCGIPSSAVHKIANQIPNEMQNDKEIINYIKHNLLRKELIQYEKTLLEKL